MNKVSTEKIRSATPFLIRFRRCLPQSIQSFVRPYLDKPYQLALTVLDCCSSAQKVTIAEIAQQAGVTKETVRQVLLALKEGGTRFSDRSKQGWQVLEEDSPDDTFSCVNIAGLTDDLPSQQPSKLDDCNQNLARF